MVDLKAQYLRIKDEIDAGFSEVLDNTAFINGPAVKTFQASLEQYLGVKHVIPCANGTDALQIAMMALGLQPGDEVIVPAFTYVATAEVIGLLELTPVMTDVDPETFNITPELIEKAITPRTKAIVPVHLFGQCADMEGIMNLARKHNLYVIEDNAQAIGADYTSDTLRGKSGALGHIGCTSFFPSKNLGCYGDGGALMTNDDDLAVRLHFQPDTPVIHTRKKPAEHTRVPPVHTPPQHPKPPRNPGSPAHTPQQPRHPDDDLLPRATPRTKGIRPLLEWHPVPRHRRPLRPRILPAHALRTG